MCFQEIIPECPIGKIIPKFPCPAPQRHKANYYNKYEATCWSINNPLCRIGAFSDLRFNDCKEQSSRCLDVLYKTLLSLSYDNVDVIVQLGNIIDTRDVNSESQIQDLIAHLANVFNKSYRKVCHVIGDLDSAVREQYVNSFMRDLAFSLERTQNNLRFCGDLYYSVMLYLSN